MGGCDEGGHPPIFYPPPLYCVTWFHKFSLHVITRKAACQCVYLSKSHVKFSLDKVLLRFVVILKSPLYFYLCIYLLSNRIRSSLEIRQ